MKDIDEKYSKKIYLNILKAIIIIFYFFLLNAAYENISSTHLETGIKILTMVFLFIAIFIFERAYKKDNDELAIQGIEILILSAYTLTTEHITSKYNIDFKVYSVVASFVFAIYFIFKSIVVYTKARKQEEENLSDIKEIVKKEEPVKKEATKKTEIPEQEEKPKSKNTEKQNKNIKTKKSTPKKVTPKKTTNKTTTKKSKKKEEVKEND